MTLQEWLLSKGYTFEPVLDGKVKRFSVEGDTGKEETGWYVGSVIISNGKKISTITVGDWRSGEKEYFRDGEGFKNGDLEHYKAALEKHKEEIANAEKEKWAEAAVKAQKIWESSSEEKAGEHPYCQKKQIKPIGIRENNGSLIVPVYIDDKISSIQRIYPDGRKQFLPGGRVKGGYFKLDGNNEVVLLAEGYATACSLHIATGCECYVAFNAGNLCTVGKVLRGLFRDKKIIVCGDDDYKTEGNPGRKYALEAASEIEAIAVFPAFFTGEDGTDFNDVHVLRGVDEVRRQINTVTNNGQADLLDSGGESNVGREEKQSEGAQSKPKKEKKSKEEREAEARERKEKKIKAQEALNRLGKEILDCRFKVFHTAEKAVLYNITNISKKEVGFCQNEEYLLRRLRQNLEETLGHAPEIGLVHQVFASWKLCTEGLKEEPATFTWKGEDRWSFKQLDFAPCVGGFPAWEEFLSRLSSREDFMAFVWSIFEMKNRSRQFLYLHDPNGEGGKSTVIRVLGSVFGDSFTSLSNAMVTGGGNRWLTAQLYGKRLVAWADCKNPKICMSELIRNITSGDPVPVEFKGGASFNTEMYVKLIIGSNHEPQITSGGADTSRLICLHLSNNNINKDDPTWESRLQKELPHFLNACRDIYTMKCGHHGKIRLDDSSIMNTEGATSDIEDRFDAIAETRIVFKKDAETSVKDWVQFCNDEFMHDSNAVGNFKEYLVRKGAAFKRKMIDGHKITVGIGFLIKPKGTFF